MIRPSLRPSGNCGSGAVVAQVEGAGAGISGLVRACAGEGDTCAVGTAVGGSVGAALDPGGRIAADPGQHDRTVVPAVGIGRTRRAGDHVRSRRVVLEWERGRCRVSGFVGTPSARSGAAGVGAAIGQRRAAGESRGRVAAAPADRDRRGVPAVVIGASSRDALDRGRRGRIELDRAREGERRRSVTGLVGTGPGRGDVGAVGAVVGQRRTGHRP